MIRDGHGGSIVCIESGSESMAVEKVETTGYNPKSLGRVLGKVAQDHDGASVLEVEQVVVVAGDAFGKDSDGTSVFKILPDALVNDGMVDRVRKRECARLGWETSGLGGGDCGC